MNDRDLERRIQDALSDASPGEDALARAREAAVRGASRAAARRRRAARRTFGLLAAAAVVLAAGATAGAIMLTQNDSPALPVAPGAKPAIGESAILARAPWLFQGDGAPYVQEVKRLPALRYPRGTTYRAALGQLTRSVAATGTLPRSAALVPALPRGAVWAPGTRKLGPRLDLTAPFGYTVPTGAISPPQFSIAGSATPAEALAIALAFRDGTPIGVGPASKIRVTAPTLRACQRLPRVAPCRLQAPPPPASR